MINSRPERIAEFSKEARIFTLKLKAQQVSLQHPAMLAK